MIIKGHKIRRVRRTLEPSSDFWTLRPRQPRFSGPAASQAPGEPFIQEPTQEPRQTNQTPSAANAPDAALREAVHHEPSHPETSLGPEADAASPNRGAVFVPGPLLEPEPEEAWQTLYARSTTPRRARRTRARRSWARAFARTAFVLAFLLGTAYYWLGPDLQLRPERAAMARRAFEWWQGMRGAALTHHRAGLQVAYIDPQTGRVFAVYDARADVSLVQRLLVLVPDGQWAAVTVLTPGDVETTTQLQGALQQYGWRQEIPPHGAAVGIFSRGAQPGQLQLIHAQVSSEPDVVLSLPRGTLGHDGARLASRFYIHVAE